MKTFDDKQLKFNLMELDEVKDDAEERLISPEEAAKISEAARMVFDHTRLAERNLDGRKWFDDYLQLIEWGWPWRVATYIAWASSPKIDRWPKTLKELATDVLGLTSPRVVYTWRQNHPTIDQVIAIMQAKPLLETRRDRFEVLAKLSVKEDYKYFDHLKLAMEMDGSYIPKSKLELGKSAESSEEELSDNELRAAVGENINSPAARGENASPMVHDDEGEDNAGE